MPSSKYPFGEDSHHTPIPTVDLISMFHHMTEIRAMVKGIREDLLPALTVDTREARDSSMKLEQCTGDLERRISQVENRIDECEATERLAYHDKAISSLQAQAKHHNTLIWWVIGVIVTIIGTMFGYAMMAKSHETPPRVEQRQAR